MFEIELSPTSLSKSCPTKLHCKPHEYSCVAITVYHFLDRKHFFSCIFNPVSSSKVAINVCRNIALSLHWIKSKPSDLKYLLVYHLLVDVMVVITGL